jgi:hypothetical protein
MVEYLPTEPIPADQGSPMTYEQGERILQLLTDFQTNISTKFDSVISLLTDIKTNLVPSVSDPSQVTGITSEQAREILDLLHTSYNVGVSALGAVAVWFVVKWLYRFIGGVIFGGV